MASASHVHLSSTTVGVYHASNIQKSSAERASDVLQKNHVANHCFFNADGFHNHVAHHILTLYALGATPEEIQKGYDVNNDYQRPAEQRHDRFIEDMSDRKNFLKYLGQGDYYLDYRLFLESELDKKGTAQTFREHLFSGDEAAERMNDQMFSGFLHPIIHAGFGIEFEQPAIQAEGLAMCAVSSQYMIPYFDGIRQQIRSNPDLGGKKSLFDLLSEMQANQKLAHSAQWDDPNKVCDGVIARAGKEMIHFASQWRVTDMRDLEKKTAEMTSFVAYFTGAALNPQKQVKFDFFYMHCINSSIFFWSFLKQPWLTDEQRACLLEKKVWTDMALYISRNTPTLYADEIARYKEKQPGDWESIFRRVNRYEDDGHSSKFIRAVANGAEKCKPFEEQEQWPIRGDMWLKLGHAVIDSVEADGVRWIRSAGFRQAWKDIADRSGAKNGQL